MQLASADHSMTGADSDLTSEVPQTAGSLSRTKATPPCPARSLISRTQSREPNSLRLRPAQVGTATQSPRQQLTANQPSATQAPETAKTDQADTAKVDENVSAATQTVNSEGKDAAPAVADKNHIIMTATDLAAPAEPKKRGFLAAFFSASPAGAAPAKGERSSPHVQLASAAPAKVEKPQPVVQLPASDEADKPLAVRASVAGGELNPLPGVRQSALFEIKRKSGFDDDSDVDLHEDEMDGSIQLASAAGLARLAPMVC